MEGLLHYDFEELIFGGPGKGSGLISEFYGILKFVATLISCLI